MKPGTDEETTDPAAPVPEAPEIPEKVDAREVFVELSKILGKVETTAKLEKESHDRIMVMEINMDAVKAESRKTSDFTKELVTFARKRDDREEAEAKRLVDAKAADKQHKADKQKATATLRARMADRLSGWWVENWKLIAVVVAILLGVNVAPLMQAFGLGAVPVAQVAAP